ncbi:MAG: archaemetzincin family Zn-dependent metalloprotease [Proteobacteria bacterium]|nr:archaemetzincin family Zn-dependent metalloprotease [Pseudomonadota bacterium]MBU1398965.1 archaemetzincin family Zn-dependent metalloprotease [Pseudomonadota bacterium]
MNIYPEHSIVISPIGNFDPEITEPVQKEINRIFGFPALIIPILEDVDFALDSGRNQYHSTSILKQLEKSAPSFAMKVIAITKVDLFIPILTHVYGEAQLGGKACVVSTYRLKDQISAANPGVIFKQRIVKEAVHELGHTFNLRHCKEHACIMHYCRTELDVDRKSDQLCRYCKILLDDEIKRLRKSGMEKKPC